MSVTSKTPVGSGSGEIEPGVRPEAEGRAPDDPVAPDTRGLNFFSADPDFERLLRVYLPGALFDHLRPHFSRLGRLVGGELSDLAATADAHPPVLHHRDKQGRDRQWIEKHPAYRRMEEIGFGEFGLAAMSHRGGVLGWPEPLPHAAKYAFTFLFTQAEFGLYCPISMSDSAARIVARFGDSALQERCLPRMLTQDVEALYQGAMFMTEKPAGSDVGATETIARRENGVWRLYGEKWFCSNADAEIVLTLARVEDESGDTQAGTRGLGMFLMPRSLEDGTPNRYRIVRLKDKLGSRSMASGEVILEGAEAWVVGELERGFRQMLEMVNVSRLSNGVRSAGLMRRSLHDALAAAHGRIAFGKPIVEHPLLRRQLLKILLPSEQALSFLFFTADALQRADEGDEGAARLARLLTPLIKFRACRDARKVTGDAMEVRGGCGYIEEWVNPRLLRDSHLGSIWEGTSNMVAMDAVLRAVGRERCDRALSAALESRLDEAQEAGAPAECIERVRAALERAVAFARDVAVSPAGETLARQAATGLYRATSAALLAWEGARFGVADGDARRLLLARLTLENGLEARDPLAVGDVAFEEATAGALLSGEAAPMDEVSRLLRMG